MKSFGSFLRQQEKNPLELDIAVFGMGSFWQAQPVLDAVDGVLYTQVGYTGGFGFDHFVSPSYESVCRGRSGYTEAVKVVYDPSVLSYAELVEIFWQSHDYSTPRKTQYASALFYRNKSQKQIAKQSMKERKLSQKSISSAVRPLRNFHEAEEYHQQYARKTQRSPTN